MAATKTQPDFLHMTMYISMHSRQSDITVENYSNLLYSGRWHDTEISLCHVFISLFVQRSCSRENYFCIYIAENTVKKLSDVSVPEVLAKNCKSIGQKMRKYFTFIYKLYRCKVKFSGK